jgi:hypothetical protein
MDVRPIDPRDTDTEEAFPAYRVYFWERQAGHPGLAPEHVGHTSYEYELTGAHSVFEALAWAEANAGPNRTFTLYVATTGPSLIRLVGSDPTATPEPFEG